MRRGAARPRRAAPACAPPSQRCRPRPRSPRLPAGDGLRCPAAQRGPPGRLPPLVCAARAGGAAAAASCRLLSWSGAAVLSAGARTPCALAWLRALMGALRGPDGVPGRRLRGQGPPPRAGCRVLALSESPPPVRGSPPASGPVWSPRGPCLRLSRCLRSRCAGGPLRAPRAACVPGGYVRSASLPVSAVAAVPSLAQSARGGLLPLAPHPGAASSAGAARPSGGLAAGGCALRCARPARLVGQVRALLCARWLMMGARCCTSPRRSRGPDPHRCPRGRAHRQTPPGGRALSGSARRIRPPRPGRAAG